MDAIAALLAEQPVQLLSASDLHSRITLLKELLEEDTRACRAELLRRPSNCQEAPSLQPAAASSPCMLLQLSHDELEMVARELCDPLRPLLAVNLSSTAKGLRVPMQAALAQLRQQHQEAEAFVAFMKLPPRLWSIEELCGATVVNISEEKLTLAQWKGLGTLIGCGSLPMIATLDITLAGCGDEEILLLAEGISRLPSLTRLSLAMSRVGDRAAAALAAALTKRPMPALRELQLSDSQIGDPGLLALVPALRQMPKLEELVMFCNEFSDQGIAALITEPMTGVLESLKVLDMSSHGVSDISCFALTSVLRSGGLPALEQVSLHGSEEEPFSPADEEMFVARNGLGPVDDHCQRPRPHLEANESESDESEAD